MQKIYAKVLSFDESRFRLYFSAGLTKRLKHKKVLVYAAEGIVVLCPSKSEIEDSIGYTISTFYKRSAYLSADTIAKVAKLKAEMKTKEVNFLSNGCVELIFENHKEECPQLIPRQRLITVYEDKSKKYKFYRIILTRLAYKLLKQPATVKLYACKGAILIEASNKEEDHKVFSTKTAYHLCATKAVKLAEVQKYKHPEKIEIADQKMLLLFPNYEEAKDLLEV